MANKIPITNAGLRTYDREKRLWAAMYVNIDLCTFRHTYTRCTYTHTHIPCMYKRARVLLLPPSMASLARIARPRRYLP